LAEHFPSLYHQDTQQCVHGRQDVKHVIDIRKIFQCLLVEMRSTLKRFPNLANIKKQQYRADANKIRRHSKLPNT
jgi:hypothetical protein